VAAASRCRAGLSGIPSIDRPAPGVRWTAFSQAVQPSARTIPASTAPEGLRRRQGHGSYLIINAIFHQGFPPGDDILRADAGLDQERDEIPDRFVAVEEDEDLGPGPALEQLELPAMVRPEQVLVHRHGNQQPGLGAKVVSSREGQYELVEQVEHMPSTDPRGLELFGHYRVEDR